MKLMKMKEPNSLQKSYSCSSFPSSFLLFSFPLSLPFAFSFSQTPFLKHFPPLCALFSPLPPLQVCFSQNFLHFSSSNSYFFRPFFFSLKSPFLYSLLKTPPFHLENMPYLFPMQSHGNLPSHNFFFLFCPSLFFPVLPLCPSKPFNFQPKQIGLSLSFSMQPTGHPFSLLSFCFFF